MPVSLRNRFPEIEATLARRISTAVKESADEIALTARENAPVLAGPGPHRPGELKDSIEARRKSPAVSAVEVGAFYGMFQEFGTSRQPARPFLVPALETHKGSTIAKVEAVLHEL